LQGNAQLPNPLRQGRTGNPDTVSFADLLNPVQRQMIQIFLDQYPGMQPRRRQATVDQRRRNGSCGDRFTGAACILRPNVAMNEETCRFDVELLADILTDLDQAGTALPTGAGCRFMTVLDARQFWRPA
jgi:hypothetical protein